MARGSGTRKGGSNQRNQPQQNRRAATKHTVPAPVSDARPPTPEFPITKPAPEERRHQEQLKAAWCLNYLTGAAAVVGLLGLLFVFLGVRETHYSTVQANRAWLAVSGPTFTAEPLKIGDPISVGVLYKNVGRGPATDIIKQQFVKWLDRPPSLHPEDVIKPSFPTNTSCDQLEFRGNIAWPDIQQMSKKLDVDLYADQRFSDGAHTILVQGCFQYRTFGETHRTTFCYWLKPPNEGPMTKGVWAYCPGEGQNAAD